MQKTKHRHTHAPAVAETSERKEVGNPELRAALTTLATYNGELGTILDVYHQAEMGLVVMVTRDPDFSDLVKRVIPENRLLTEEEVEKIKAELSKRQRRRRKTKDGRQ